MAFLENVKRYFTTGEVRAAPGEAAKSPMVIVRDSDFHDYICHGYIPLADNPEIMTAVGTIADIISSMTIYLMENTEEGDKRVKDGLSRLVDIEPNKLMTRKTFMYNVVRTMLLEGRGNAFVLPIFQGGYLEEFKLLNPYTTSIVQNGDGYLVQSGGLTLTPDQVLHFPINPRADEPWKGRGLTVQLRDVAKNLNQEAATKNGFLSSKIKPSVVIKVDSNADELANPEARAKFAEQYLHTTREGDPWMIPAELMDVQSIKPLTLNDLAINDTINIDKKTAAAIIGVPSFLLGVGEFKADEWNNFINTKIKFICEIITQEMTRKLLVSPNRYWKFNIRSLLSYDIKTLSEVGGSLYDKGIVTGNEVRDWIDLSPREGLNELKILENYIPAEMSGEQNKLKGGGNE